jgi:hypothetical protein
MLPEISYKTMEGEGKMGDDMIKGKKSAVPFCTSLIWNLISLAPSECLES